MIEVLAMVLELVAVFPLHLAWTLIHTFGVLGVLAMLVLYVSVPVLVARWAAGAGGRERAGDRR